MTTINISKESFQATRKFYDDKNYPRGFNRSGDFTLSEGRILETYGIALQELMSGTKTPINDEEKQFILVCEGKAEATSQVERAWKKYQNKVLSPKHFHTLFGRRKVDADESDSNDSDADIDLDLD
jgi:uncharacterized protein